MMLCKLENKIREFYSNYRKKLLKPYTASVITLRETNPVADQSFSFVAVKYVWIDPKLDRKRLEREFRVLERLDHPNIVKYYGMHETIRNHSAHFAIYIEFCERKSLKSGKLCAAFLFFPFYSPQFPMFSA